MKISDQQLEEFMVIYRRVHGEELTDGEAYDLATRLLRLGEILLGLDAPEQN